MIACRARISSRCLHGHQWPDPETGPWEDGTYERNTNTIVCDACYVALMPYSPSGQLLRDEIPSALRRARAETEPDPTSPTGPMGI